MGKITGVAAIVAALFVFTGCAGVGEDVGPVEIGVPGVVTSETVGMRWPRVALQWDTQE